MKATETTIPAWQMAIKNRPIERNLIFHRSGDPVRGQRYARITVHDTGSGISELERHAVLKRFYRSDRTAHTSGLGLGLNLVAAIVKLHGFRFTIRPGAGCIVEIACPHASMLS